MNTLQKYLTSITLSHIICSLIFINKIANILQTEMYIYIFLPIVILIVTAIIYKYLQSKLIYLIAFAIQIFCIYMFWTNSIITKVLFTYEPILWSFLYLLIMILCAITFAIVKPNEFYGIKIQQTLDYPDVWKKTHTFTSLLLTFVILPTYIVIFSLEPKVSFFLCNIFLIFSFVIGIVYAVIITIPIEKAEKEQIEKELQDQIKKEQGYR